MDDSRDGTGVFRCGSCGNVGLGDGDIGCCDGPMARVDGDERVVEPSLEELLGTVFDMSESELDVCLCVMTGGDQTVQELAERTDFDRSVVARHLAHLVELGVVDRRRRLLRQGGHVYVYEPNDEATVRRNLESHFLGWLAGALEGLESIRREKVEGIVEAGSAAAGTEPQWKIYRDE